jgi:tetratricopeptide (TPR) repeat protein
VTKPLANNSNLTEAHEPACCMQGTVTTDLCSKGIRLHDEGQLIAALSCFEKALLANPSPLAQSYLGVCVAAERGQVNRGIALCSDAIAAEPGNPVHHLNLARLLIRAGRKGEALAALRHGIAAGEHAEIRVLLDQIGTRRPPLFPALPRRHPLNRILGLILARFRRR